MTERNAEIVALIDDSQPPRKPRGNAKPKREPSWDDAKHKTKPRLSDLMAEVLRDEEGALSRSELVDAVKKLYARRWGQISQRGVAGGVGNALKTGRFVDIGGDVWNLAEDE